MTLQVVKIKKKKILAYNKLIYEIYFNLYFLKKKKISASLSFTALLEAFTVQNHLIETSPCMLPFSQISKQFSKQ